MERRRVRDNLGAERVLKSCLRTRMAAFLDRNPFFSMISVFVNIAVEVTAVGLYFQSLEAYSCRGSSRSPQSSFQTVTTLSITQVPAPRHTVHALAGFGVYFLIQYLVFLYLSPNRRAFLQSKLTVVSALTIVPLFIAYFSETALPVAPEGSDSLGSGGGGGAPHGSDVGNGNVAFEQWTVASWAPTFLRVWWLHRHCAVMLNTYFTQVHPAIKVICMLGVLVSCMVTTGMALVQVFDAWGGICFTSLSIVFYLVMVTITTVGYGDVAPTTYGGRAVMSLVIFAAMFYLPTVIGTLQELISYLKSQNSYQLPLSHVIVCGTFTLLDVEVILQDFLQEARLHVVLVTETPMDEETVRFLQQPSLRQRVTVCVSDVLQKGQIIRYGARSAVAIFLVSPRAAVAQRGDYDTMRKSIFFFRYEPAVPQFLMLKRGVHTSTMRRCADVVFERQRLKYHLMGNALRLPRFIPFLINLLKPTKSVYEGEHIQISGLHSSRRVSYSPLARRRSAGRRGTSPVAGADDDEEEEEMRGAADQDDEQQLQQQRLHQSDDDHKWNWRRLYLHGASSNIVVVRVPPSLDGRMFAAVTLIIANRLSVTCIGLLRRSTDLLQLDEVLIAPVSMKVSLHDKLIIIAPAIVDANGFVELFQDSTTTAFTSSISAHAVPPTAGSLFGTKTYENDDPDGGGGGDGYTTNDNVHDTSFAHMPLLSTLHGDGRYDRGGSPNPAPIRRASSLTHGKPLRAEGDGYPFQNHVLLVDLSSPTGETLNDEEVIQSDACQAMDILRLLRAVLQVALQNKEAAVPVVYLSTQSLSERFAEAWPDACLPIYHLRGFGTDVEHLKTAGVMHCRAAVVFHSVECERRDATSTVVADMIRQLLLSVGRANVVPVVTELLDVSVCTLVPPRMSTNTPEKLMEQARDNYVCSASYFTGKVISEPMVDALIFQCLHNASLPTIIAALMGIRDDLDGEDILQSLKKRIDVECNGDDDVDPGGRRSEYEHQEHLAAAVRRAKGGVFGPDIIFCESVERFIPESLHPLVEQLRYGDLFYHAIREGCVLLGLDRVLDTDVMGADVVGERFFATCPPLHVRLRRDDCVFFILGTPQH